MSQRAGKFVLPQTKKIALNQNRGLDSKILNDQISEIVLGMTKEGPKEILLRIKPDASYEFNVNILLHYDVNKVRDTLLELKGDPEGLNKDGICLAILKELQKSMPHKCNGCDEIISIDMNYKIAQKCIACGTQLCMKCCNGSKVASVC